MGWHLFKTLQGKKKTFYTSRKIWRHLIVVPDGEREELGLLVIGRADDRSDGRTALDARTAFFGEDVVADNHQTLGRNSDCPELGTAVNENRVETFFVFK